MQAICEVTYSFFPPLPSSPLPSPPPPFFPSAPSYLAYSICSDGGEGRLGQEQGNTFHPPFHPGILLYFPPRQFFAHTSLSECLEQATSYPTSTSKDFVFIGKTLLSFICISFCHQWTTYLQSNGIQREIPRVPHRIIQSIFNSFQLRSIFLQKLAILPQLCLSDDFYKRLRFD